MLHASPKLLKHIAMTGALALTTWMGTALAQTPSSSEPASPSTSPTSPAMPGPTSSAPTTRETDTMENYLTNHPKVADELHNNPSLINNPEWLSKHPQVQNWMNTHPNVKSDAAANPSEFVHHTEHETLNRDRQSVNHTDQFLSQHPGLAKQLNENPRLIDDPKFVADHPALNNYLNTHPGVKNEWENHPQAFADAARADEKYNKTGKVPPIDHPAKTAAKK